MVDGEQKDRAHATAEGFIEFGTPSEGLRVLAGSVLWVQWAEVAIEREGSARVARAHLVAQYRHGQNYAPKLTEEFTASIVAVSAAAHALDALYGQLITAELKVGGPKDDTGRQAHIRECLKKRFNTDTGKKNQSWIASFRWLFKLRDAGVHAKVVLQAPAAHPSGICNVAQEFADYSAEAAMRAVDLVVDVLGTCVASPKQSDAESVKWGDDYGPAVETITTMRDVSRDARPLITGLGFGLSPR